MTFTQDFEQQDFGAESKYPVAFGITFTPKVSGIAFGGLGLLGAVYVFMNMVMPAYNDYQTQKTEETNLQQQVETQKSGEFVRKIQAAEQQLREKEYLKEQILALFASEKSLKTILFDVNRFFDARNVDLLSFTPQGDPAPIADGSLGPQVDNKLKRQTISIEMEGGFEQTQSVLRDLERLQPLILVKNLNTQAVEQEKEGGAQLITTGEKAQVVEAPKKVKTSVTLDVILPLTKEEWDQLNPPAPPPAEQPK